MSWLLARQSTPAVLRLAFLMLLMVPSVATAAEALVLRIDGGIGPATVEYVRHGLDEAVQRKAALVVLELDTPGGLEVSMREIVKAMLAAPVPIVAYVTPSGGRAASAGTYILYAAQVAAMAPGTNIGAATPVQLMGSDDGKDPKQVGMHEKMVNDAAAFLRSLAELRGRNADFAERAVRDAATLSAEAALSAGAIDLIAVDRNTLLERLDGRTVRVGQSDMRIDTKDITATEFAPGWRSQLLTFLADPNVAYLLLTVGTAGVVAEMWLPGTVLPGLTGVICLLLAFYAMQMLPVNQTGLVLLALGLVLMVAELFVAGFGALGIGGIVAFVAGSIMLFDAGEPGYGVAWPLIAGIACSFALVIGTTVVMVICNRRRLAANGLDRLLQLSAEVLEWQDGRGWVRVRGERWAAVGPADLTAGELAAVRARNGLTLSIDHRDETP